MKKRFFSLLLSFGLICSLSMSACSPAENVSASSRSEDSPASSLPEDSTLSSPSEQPPEVSADPAPLEEQPAGEDASHILVAYFSATGTTKGVAETIGELLQGDLFEIVPQQPYSPEDLDYTGDCRANEEQQDDLARPSLAPDCLVENWEDYDTVFLGYPIWWGIPPKIMRTFAESYSWEGKNIVGFCTSGGSGYSNEGLPELTEGGQWLGGQRFSGSATAEEVARWLEGLSFQETEAQGEREITVSFNGHTYSVSLADNTSAQAFVELLTAQGGSVTVAAEDYGNFEKVGPLPQSLPRNDQPLDTSAGDLILYQGNRIVLYYANNSWTFTPLGRLEGDLSHLREELGEGDVSITYALAE